MVLVQYNYILDLNNYYFQPAPDPLCELQGGKYILERLPNGYWKSCRYPLFPIFLCFLVWETYIVNLPIEAIDSTTCWLNFFFLQFSWVQNPTMVFQHPQLGKLPICKLRLESISAIILYHANFFSCMGYKEIWYFWENVTFWVRNLQVDLMAWQSHKIGCCYS